MVLDYQVRDKIAFITMNRPEAMNAMNEALKQQLRSAIEEVDRDPEVWVAVVTGAGDKAFSAGGDLKEYVTRELEGPGQPYAMFKHYDQPMSVKPFIAAVNGYCLAGGLELALACDIRIASQTASFGCPEPRWGLLHGYGAVRLPKAIGMSDAMEMLLTGDFINAEKALRLGLVSRVVPSDELMPTAEALARRICENAPLSVRVTRDLAYRGSNMPHNEALHLVHTLSAALYESADSKEGPRAFSEKRKPNYQAR